MTDFDSIWRTQDEIRTVVNAVLGECIWNLSYDERRSAIVLELTFSLMKMQSVICAASSQYRQIMMESVLKELSSFFTYNKEGNRISTIPRSPLSRHMIDFTEQP